MVEALRQILLELGHTTNDIKKDTGSFTAEVDGCHGEALCETGCAYRDGMCVTKDFITASRLLFLAEKAHYEPAKTAYKALHEDWFKQVSKDWSLRRWYDQIRGAYNQIIGAWPPILSYYIARLETKLG